MTKNMGKAFEQQVFKSFSEVDGVSIDRIPDQVTRYRGSSSNICDFTVYRYPVLVYLECKTVHGNTLPFANIRENQWNGLLEKSKIDGVVAGVLCWWVDKDVTRFIHIDELEMCRHNGYKSIRYNHEPFYVDGFLPVNGDKKRVYYDYDMKKFMDDLDYWVQHWFET